LKLQVHERTGRDNKLFPLWAVSAFASSSVLHLLLCCHGKVLTLAKNYRSVQHLKFFAGIKDLITEVFVKNQCGITLLRELHDIGRFFGVFFKAKLTC
jgi:hypothetical protein